MATAAACFACRLSFKANPCCPNCGGPLTDMGKNFRAPRRTEVAQWRKVELWYTAGAVAGRTGCSCEFCTRSRWALGTGYLRIYKPRTLSDAKDQIHLRRSGIKQYASPGAKYRKQLRPRVY